MLPLGPAPGSREALRGEPCRATRDADREGGRPPQHVPGSLRGQSAHTLFVPTATLSGSLQHPHFIEEEIEAQEVKQHPQISQLVRKEPRIKLHWSDSKANALFPAASWFWETLTGRLKWLGTGVGRHWHRLTQPPGSHGLGNQAISEPLRSRGLSGRLSPSSLGTWNHLLHPLEPSSWVALRVGIGQLTAVAAIGGWRVGGQDVQLRLTWKPIPYPVPTCGSSSPRTWESPPHTHTESYTHAAPLLRGSKAGKLRLGLPHRALASLTHPPPTADNIPGSRALVCSHAREGNSRCSAALLLAVTPPSRASAPRTPLRGSPHEAQLGRDGGQGQVQPGSRAGRGPARAAGRQDTWVSQKAAELRALYSGGAAAPQSCSRREVSCHFC